MGATGGGDDNTQLPRPPANASGKRGKNGCFRAFVVTVVMLIFAGLGLFVLAVRASIPKPFACTTEGKSSGSIAPPTAKPGDPLPESALDIAHRLTPSFGDWSNSLWSLSGAPGEPPFAPTQWSATPGANKATSTFSYNWVLGDEIGPFRNPRGGPRHGEASVEVYDSPQARLIAEKALAAQTKKTMVCFADCGPVLVRFQVKAEKTTEQGSDSFHDDDRHLMGTLTSKAQAALDSIYGDCPAPEYANKN